MKFGKLMAYGEVNAPIKSYVLLTTWLLRSLDKLQKEYFFLQKIYGHSTLQGADMWWGEAHNEVARIWSRDHKRSCVKLKTQYLLFYKGYTVTLGRVVTYDSLIMQLCEVTRSQNLKRNVNSSPKD